MSALRSTPCLCWISGAMYRSVPTTPVLPSEICSSALRRARDRTHGRNRGGWGGTGCEWKESRWMRCYGWADLPMNPVPLAVPSLLSSHLSPLHSPLSPLTCLFPLLLPLLRPRVLRQPEVPDLDLPRRVQKDVLGLEVPVHDALGVNVRQSRQYLPQDGPPLLLREPDAAVQQLHVESAGAVLHLQRRARFWCGSTLPTVRMKEGEGPSSGRWEHGRRN